MKDFTAKQILKAVERRGFDVFKNDTKPYNLNIIGIRSANPVVNEFNCLMAVIWHYEGQWNLFKMQMTSLPGLYWLVNPSNPLGCAILKRANTKAFIK